MQLLPAFLLSISYNLDNIVIGLAYSLKGIRVDIKSNLLIAAITSLGTLLSMLCGTYIITYIPYGISGFLGSGVLILIGLYMLIKSVLNLKKENREYVLGLKDIDRMMDYADSSDKDHSKNIDMKEALFVAAGLSINNIGAGIVAAAAGINTAAAVISTFVFSALFLWGGLKLGSTKLSVFFGRYAPLVSGIIIIALGLIQLMV